MAEDDQRVTGPVRRRPSRRAVTLVSIPLIFLVIISYVGDAMAPSLVDRHPAWLIALNARTRNLALVTNDLDPWTYYGIGFVRLVVSDPLFFLLGYWYGDAAVEWMERRTRTWGQMLRQVEKWFGKAAYPIVFIAPNNYICLFAGAAGMSLRAFVVLNVSGSLFRLWLVRVFGRAFEAPIDAVVDWIGDNRGILLVVTVGLVLVSIALEARSGETEVGSLARLDEELDEAEAARRQDQEEGTPPDPSERSDAPD
jgi:membrane protein DedA with SNARE-associated domain